MVFIWGVLICISGFAIAIMMFKTMRSKRLHGFSKKALDSRCRGR